MAKAEEPDHITRLLHYLALGAERYDLDQPAELLMLGRVDELRKWARGTRFVGVIQSDDKDDDAPGDLLRLLADAAEEGKLKLLAVRLLELHRGALTETEQ